MFKIISICILVGGILLALDHVHQTTKENIGPQLQQRHAQILEKF